MLALVRLVLLWFHQRDQFMDSRLVWCATQRLYCTLAHVLVSTTVPSRKPWTHSTHDQWPLSAQHSVHLAVAVMRKARSQGRHMQVPYELVEIILKHVVM